MCTGLAVWANVTRTAEIAERSPWSLEVLGWLRTRVAGIADVLSNSCLLTADKKYTRREGDRHDLDG